ncbi:MAG TPA: TrmH family RNA methyltransferase [Geopsychrobacteraceae bacterium]
MKRRDHHVQKRYDKERQRNVLAKPGVHRFCLVLDHLKPFFNPPKIFRSAEAFGAAAVHLVGIETFDPAPAKGSFRKVPARFHDDFKTCYEQLVADGYTLYRLDPQARESLCRCALPEKTAFILGHEEFGFSFDPADYPAIRSLSIPQYGSVQSLNVSIAASIVMYEYVRQYAGKS